MNPNGNETNPSNPPPSGQPNPWEQTLGEIDAPKKNEITIGNVLEHRRKIIEKSQGRVGGWETKDVVESIKQEIGFEEPVIRGPVEVAKGDNFILALNMEQLVALGVLLNFYPDEVMSREYYALVESTGNDPRKAEARLKFAVIKLPTENHFVISMRLAKELGIDQQKKDIRILNVYQKIEDIDLDKI